MIELPCCVDRCERHNSTQLMSISYYKRLIDIGVKVYEYESGFLHAKVYLSDELIKNTIRQRIIRAFVRTLSPML